MRILVITQYFWPENFRINDLCSELSERNHEITVLTGYPNYPEGKILSEFKNNKHKYSKLNKIKIYRVPLFPRGNTKWSLILNYLSFMLTASFIGPIKLMGRDFDLVFVCQLSPATVAVPGVVFSRLKQVPMAMWILDIWPDSLKAVGVLKNKRALLFINSCMNYIYKRCKLIFVQSKSFKEKIERGMIIPTQIIYSPTWAEKKFEIQNKDEIAKGKCDNKSFIVTFAGNIGQAQDMDCIVEAAEILKNQTNIKFHIVGDGRDYQRLKLIVTQRGLTNTVKLFGRRPLDEMPYFFEKSDALLLTLTDEEIFTMTIPGKLQSYLAFGKPIVAAINGEASNIIELSGAGFCVKSSDSNALANTIDEMSKMNKIDLIALGKNGKDYYKKVFDREIVINEIEYQLNSMIK